MIQAIARFFTNIVHRYLPDPLVFAIALTVITFVMGFTMTPHTPMDMVQMWGDGFWNLLAFTMQMALVVVTGHALASSPPVKRFLETVASLAKTPAQGVMLVTFLGSMACIINWGFGLIVGAMFAKEVARRVPKSDYRLLVACAYIAFLTWHGGFSGSVPLLAATKGNPMEASIGLIPVSETLFAGYNLFITGALIVTLPFLTRFMMSKDESQIVEIDPALLKDDSSNVQRKLGPNSTVAEKIEESPIGSWIVGAMGIVYLGMYFIDKGFNININTVNMIFLTAGILLHRTPAAYGRAITNGARSTASVMLQFPFYAGIQIMMEHSGLGGIITNWFVDIATKETFPVLAFLSSGIINFAVPSGGGHWVVQGPFIMPAAQALGADMGKAAMAIAYGEAWMNMAQPFWALPALAIAGLGIRDIMGYCVTALLFSGVIFIVGLTLF